MWRLIILAAVPCFTHPPFTSSISHCKPSDDPNADCNGAYFVQTDGKHQSCSDHADCYDFREPINWCRPSPEQKWTNEGCHCDPKLRSCVMDREVYGRLEYSYCRSALDWYCP